MKVYTIYVRGRKRDDKSPLMLCRIAKRVEDILKKISKMASDERNLREVS